MRPGDLLGPYRVVSELGAGGMGEVYRARDTSLNRDVAVKVLPEAFGGDPDRLARFQREAEALAALNHPNIAQIYGLESSGASPAIVMELVEGPTLADRLRTGRIPLPEALRIARQVAEALEAAHERGIVHRDLKPANIKVTGEGAVKVLDFGLAKVLEPPGDASAELANSPTLTARGTQMGVILGTAAYMAPEQAKGKPVDKRADLWAFGCVLYEMLTGRRAFEGDDVSDTLAGVLKLAPDFEALPAGTPPAIAKLLRRCLEKDRKNRLADVADARLEIDEALAAGTVDVTRHASPVASGVSPRTLAMVAAATLVLGALLSGAIVWSLRAPRTVPVSRFVAVSEPTDPIGAPLNSPSLAISRDGRHVVYSLDGGQLAVRPMDSLSSRPLANLGSEAYGPFFSWDGAWVGFNDQADDTLKRVSINGGAWELICAIDSGRAVGASWGENDTIVFGTANASGLWQVPAGGGDPVEISTAEPGTNHVWPDILPGGRAVLFTIRSDGGLQDEVALLDLDSGTHTVLFAGGSFPRYSPTGHIVYGGGGALRAVGFDAGSGRLTTSSVPILDNIITKNSGAAEFAVGDDGSLVYIPGQVGVAARELVWVDRGGREERIDAASRAYHFPRLSPDGQRLALHVEDEENDIWIWQLARKTLTRLTNSPGVDRSPVWSPTGDRIFFSSSREGVANLFWAPADFSGTAVRLTNSANPQYTMSVAPNGEVLFAEDAGSSDLLALQTGEPESRVRPLVATASAEWNGEVSPDGQSLAYQSNESGEYQVYVLPFPDVNGARVQASIDGGTRPAWRADGLELFYLTDTHLMAVPVEPGRTLTLGTPVALFAADDYARAAVGRTYDVTADGQRFVFIRDAEEAAPGSARQIIAVLNWFEELTRLVPGRE